MLGGALPRALTASFRAAAASARAGAAPQPWATGAWGATAARHRAPTCAASSPRGMSPAAGLSSSSAAAAAAAEAAPSTIIDVPPAAAGGDGSGVAAASAEGLATLEDLKFDNTFTAELPADDSEVNRPRQVRCRAGLHGLHAVGGPARLFSCCLPSPPS